MTQIQSSTEKVWTYYLILSILFNYYSNFKHAEETTHETNNE